MNDVAWRYQAMHGKQLTLHGYGLRARLNDGTLPGLMCNESSKTMELDGTSPSIAREPDEALPSPQQPAVQVEREEPAGAADPFTRPAGTTTVAQPATHAPTADRAAAPSTPDSSRLADELRWLVIKEGPLLLKDVSSSYVSCFRKSYGGRKLKASLVRGSMKGLRYNESSERMELQPVDTLPSNATRLDQARPVPQPTAHAGVRAGAAGPFASPAEATTTVPATAGPTDGRAARQASPRDADVSDAASKMPPQETLQRPVSASKRPVPTSRRASGIGGASHPSPPTAAASSPSSPASGTEPPYLLIDHPATCKKALAAMPCVGNSLQRVCMGSMVAVRLNGRQLGSEDGFISLVKLQIFGPVTPKAIIFDVVTLNRTRAGQALLRDQLCPLLADQGTTKIVHGFNNSAMALRRCFGAGFAIRQVLDLQLAFEAVFGRISADAVSVMRAFGVDASYSDAASRAFSFEEVATARRPLDTSTLGRAAVAVSSLAKVAERAVQRLLEVRQKDEVLRASQLGIEFAVSAMLRDTRRVAFRNHGSCWGGGTGRVLTSFELKQAREISAREMVEQSAPARELLQPSELLQSSRSEAASADGGNLTSFIGNMKSFLDSMKLGETAATAVDDDPNSPSEILKLIPDEFLQDHLTERHKQNLQDLVELVIDEGRRPYAMLQEGRKLYLCNNETIVVARAHIDKVVGRLDSEGRFGFDNRAGVPGQLHRVSVMRSRDGGRIYGVTLRIGRYFPGSASVIDDLLFHVQDGPDKPDRAASILVLGKPGSGKTTVLRDICRKVSEEQTVVIVDTSNEIAGDGDIPHLQAIGQSRRMMVSDKDGQHSVMKEALQNHTPQTIVVDEVSNKLEARACLDIKARGVRMVASAHGDLQSLLKNPELNTLVGGSTSVTLGDTLAQATNGGNKVQAQRAGAPIFDVVVEVERGNVCTWSIVRNVDLAVDAILDGKPYEVEKRTCIPPEDSGLQQQASDPDDVAFLLKCEKEVEKTRQYY
eukprot:g3497.t1